MTTTTQHQNTTDWNTAPVGDLIDHIVNTHHVFLRGHLPKLQAMFERLLGKSPDKLCGFVPSLAKTFFGLQAELNDHLLKEEQILFPHVRRLAEARAAGRPAPAFHCGSVAGPIHQMEHEHANGKRALEEMRKIATGYPMQEGMCQNRRALFEELLALETDLHEHMHLENDILHPRATALEQSTKS